MALLSVLARGDMSTLADSFTALHGRRKLGLWMAMCRTLFDLPRADIPVFAQGNV